MANILDISFLSPFAFVSKDRALAIGFHLKQFDDFLFTEQIYDFQYPKTYCQPVQNSDNIYFQVVSNFGPVTCRLIDRNEYTIATATVEAVSTAFYTDKTCWGVTIDTTTIQRGFYQIEVTVGVGLPQRILVTNPIKIDSNFENTILFRYQNSTNKAGVIFENGEMMQMRVEALLTDFQPASTDFVFEDQTADLVTISSTPFRSWKLVFGDSPGLPDWVIDRVNRFFGCDILYFDDKAFCKAEGAKFERNGDRENPLNGWTVEVRERYNLDGVTITNDDPDTGLAIIYGVQDTNADPVDFSQFITASPYLDIVINYGVITAPKYFWMWHASGPTVKSKYQDLNNPLNLGSIGSPTDLFSTKSFNIDGVDGVLYMTRIKTGFAPTNRTVKYYNITADFNPPGNFRLTLVEPNTPDPGDDRLTFAWDVASPAPLSYTIRQIDVTDGGIITLFEGITTTTKVIVVPNDLTFFKFSVKSVYAGGDSIYSPEINYP